MSVKGYDPNAEMGGEEHLLIEKKNKTFVCKRNLLLLSDNSINVIPK